MTQKNNRHSRKKIAEQTLEILATGRYFGPSGGGVYFDSDQQNAETGTICYSPQAGDQLLQEAVGKAAGTYETEIYLRNETTLAAARRLVQETGVEKTCALNFASAKNPGGGFLGGSQAQEESLARASGLYPTLNAQKDYYQTNRSFGSTLYSDYMIWSPQVPVFRDDNDQTIDPYYLCSFITCPAPNAGAVQHNRKSDIPQIGPTMQRRIAKILALAVHQGQEAIVLGAWGCGVFRNDPEEVASYFAEALLSGGDFQGAFKRVDFAVLDSSKAGNTFQAFAKYFDPA